MNKNCLKGYRCPNCYSEGPFNIETICVTEWHDDGTEDSTSWEFEPGGTWICRGCRFIGKEEDFDIKKSEAEPRFAEWVKDRYAKDGDLEFDDHPKVSRGESNGAYVACWKWIDNPQCLTCFKPIEGKPFFDEHLIPFCKKCWKAVKNALERTTPKEKNK